MSETVLVNLEKIKPNPYPMRDQEDPGKVRELAIDIFRRGMQQDPAARRVNGDYELVFGHTRRAAHQLLATKGVPEAGIEPDAKYSEMPLVVREGLSERDMFELGAAENLKRADMNAIEVAKALRRYMDEFEATSQEAGELFGLEAATVRGKVRLLDLPAAVQTKVAAGELPEVAARKLLTLQRVAPDAIVDAGNEVVEGEDVEEVVSGVMRSAPGVRLMWERWSSKEPRGGDGLWLLSAPAEKFPALPELGWSQALKALGMESTESNRNVITKWISNGPSNLATDWEDLGARFEHLVNPPACTACPFYAKANGNHYCGFEACHKRKKTAWMGDVLAKASKKLKIPIYDKSVDGVEKINLERWKHEGEFSKGNANIRLMLGGSPYNNFEGVPKGVRAVFVGDSAKRIKAARKQKESGRDWREEQRIHNVREHGINQLMWEAGVEHFLPAIKGLDNLAVLDLLEPYESDWTGKKPAKNAAKKTKVAWLQRAIVGNLLDDALPWQLKNEKQCVELAAKHLQGMAKEWGMKLPADWLQKAKSIQASVAAETGEASKAKEAKK